MANRVHAFGYVKPLTEVVVREHGLIEPLHWCVVGSNGGIAIGHGVGDGFKMIAAFVPIGDADDAPMRVTFIGDNNALAEYSIERLDTGKFSVQLVRTAKGGDWPTKEDFEIAAKIPADKKGN